MTLRSYFGKFTQTSDLLCISQCFIQYPTLSMKPITHVTSEIYLNGIADEKWCTNLFCCWSDFCKSDFFLRLMHVTLPVFGLLHLTLGSIVLLPMLILLRWRLYYKKNLDLKWQRIWSIRNKNILFKPFASTWLCVFIGWQSLDTSRPHIILDLAKPAPPA